MKVTLAYGLLACLALAASGQTATTAPPNIQASGQATVRLAPDQAQLSVGVTTNGATAQEAADRNATQTSAVITAIRSILGTLGSIETSSYSVSPRYSTGSGQPPTIVGYTATNTLQVTTTDLSLAGRLIDAATQAGANIVGGLQFGLRDPEPARQKALAAAARQARVHADAIANGLGVKTGSILEAREGASVTPYLDGRAATTATPIETGTVAVTATVTLTVRLIE